MFEIWIVNALLFDLAIACSRLNPMYQQETGKKYIISKNKYMAKSLWTKWLQTNLQENSHLPSEIKVSGNLVLKKHKAKWLQIQNTSNTHTDA